MKCPISERSLIDWSFFYHVSHWVGEGGIIWWLGNESGLKIYIYRKQQEKKKKNRHILSTQLILFSFYASKEINVIKEGQNSYYVQCTHKMSFVLLRSNPMQCCFWKHSFSITYPAIFMVGSSPVHNQNLHWKLGQQTPSAGTISAYLETTV